MQEKKPFKFILKNEDIQNSNRIRSTLPPFFCPMPFSTLILNPDGRVGFCRERTNNDIIGNIKEQSLMEIWNGEAIRKVRREFLSGKIETCCEQIRDRRCFEQNFNQAILPHIEFSEYQKNPPIRLSPDFNGQCNLQCVMCNIWQLPNGLYDELDFWKNAEKDIFPNLLMLDPLAGEPFIQKDFYRLLDIMAKINPDCVWRFTTNLHWEFNDKIKKTLDNVKNIFGFICSIDAFTPETYHRIRQPGHLEIVHKCLDQLIQYRRERIIRLGPQQKFGITVAMALQRDNWHEAPDFMRWAHALGVEPGLQGVYFPEPLSIFKIPSLEKRKEILDFLISEMDFRDLIHIYRITTPLAATMPPELEHEYKMKIIETYFQKSLPVEAMAECNQSLPRFIESFSPPNRHSICKRILDYTLDRLSWEQVQAAGGLWPKLVTYLSETDRHVYNMKLINFAKTNATSLILDALGNMTFYETK